MLKKMTFICRNIFHLSVENLEKILVNFKTELNFCSSLNFENVFKKAPGQKTVSPKSYLIEPRPSIAKIIVKSLSLSEKLLKTLDFNFSSELRDFFNYWIRTPKKVKGYRKLSDTATLKYQILTSDFVDVFFCSIFLYFHIVKVKNVPVLIA